MSIICYEYHLLKNKKRAGHGQTRCTDRRDVNGCTCMQDQPLRLWVIIFVTLILFSYPHT